MSEIIKNAMDNIDPKAKQRVDKMIKEGSESLYLFDVSVCDVDDCKEPIYSPTEAGDLCEEHYDAYFQALDNASRC